MLFFPLLLALVLVPLLLSPTARTYIDDALARPEVQEFLGPQTLGSLLQISLRIRAGPAAAPTAGDPYARRAVDLFVRLAARSPRSSFGSCARRFPRWFKSSAERGRSLQLPSPSLHFALLLGLYGADARL